MSYTNHPGRRHEQIAQVIEAVKELNNLDRQYDYMSVSDLVYGIPAPKGINPGRWRAMIKHVWNNGEPSD